MIRDSQLSQAVAAKLEDGNVRAVVRLLMSEDSPAEPSSDSLAKLQEKHPQATVRADDLPPSPQSRVYPWTSPKSVWWSSQFQLVLLEVWMV